jgi:hypothetical protein
MKKNIAIEITFCLLLITVVGCKDGFKNKFSRENKYISEEGKFKVNFPNPPKVSSEIIPYSAGNFTIPMHMFLDEETAVKTAVIYADYPKGILKGTDNNAQKVLSGAKEGALGSLAGNMGSYVVQSQKDIVVNDYPGIIFSAKFESGLCVIYQLVLVNDRLYQLRMFNEKEYPKKEISDKFFNSFEITE